jgi:hypothetical protein
MKAARFGLIVIFALGVIVSFCGVSFAESGKDGCKAWKESNEATTKILQDSVTALQKSNPDLAKGLTDYANEKAKEQQAWKECKERYEARTKLLTDSAAALEKTNPDLAKSLKEMSEHKYDKKMHEMKKEENEKEEIGEKIEPKEEQNEKQ